MTIFWSWDEVHQIQEGGCCSQNHYPITCYLVLPPIFKFSEMISIIYVFHHKMVSISVVYIIIWIYMFKTINFRHVYRPFYHFWARKFSDFFYWRFSVFDRQLFRFSEQKWKQNKIKFQYFASVKTQKIIVQQRCKISYNFVCFEWITIYIHITALVSS